MKIFTTLVFALLFMQGVKAQEKPKCIDLDMTRYSGQMLPDSVRNLYLEAINRMEQYVFFVDSCFMIKPVTPEELNLSNSLYFSLLKNMSIGNHMFTEMRNNGVKLIPKTSNSQSKTSDSTTMIIVIPEHQRQYFKED